LGPNTMCTSRVCFHSIKLTNINFYKLII
jgi:hypothetical protein